MKRTLLLAGLLAGAIALSAQQTMISANRIHAKSELKVSDRLVSQITYVINGSSTHGQLPTAKAIYDYCVSYANANGATLGQVLEWNGSAWAPAVDDAGGVTDGDKGDITASGGGLTWNIDANTVTPTEIADDAVGASEIAAGAVGNGEIAANAITTDKIAPSAVEDTDIATGAVGTSEIANGAIIAVDLNDMGASSGQVLKWNGSVWEPSTDNAGGISDGDKGDVTVASSGTDWQIDAGAVGQTEIATDGVAAPEIATDAVGAAEIAADAVGAAEIATDAVGASEIAADAVGTSEIATNGVGTAEITDAAVTMAKINQASASSGQVIKWNGSAWAPAADNAGSIADGDKGDVTVSSSGTVWDIDNGVVGSTEITNLSVDTIDMKTSSITSRAILDGAINSVDLANASVTMAKIAQAAATTNQVIKWNGTAWAPADDATGVSTGIVDCVPVYNTTNSFTSSTALKFSGGLLQINAPASPTAKLSIKGAGATTATFSAQGFDSGSVEVWRVDDDGYFQGEGFSRIGQDMTGLFKLNARIQQPNTVNSTLTSGATFAWQSLARFTPTSGTGAWTAFEITGDINQTGGANGATIGLNVSNNLISATNYTAINAGGLMRAERYGNPTGITPTVSAGTGAGTGPTLTMAGGPTFMKLTIATGTTPTLNGNIATVTLPASFTTACVPVFSEGNATTAAQNDRFYISSSGAGSFVITNQGTALSASTTYILYIHVGGY